MIGKKERRNVVDGVFFWPSWTLLIEVHIPYCCLAGFGTLCPTQDWKRRPEKKKNKNACEENCVLMSARFVPHRTVYRIVYYDFKDLKAREIRQ